jgi:enterochelin esterase-like enzyme
VVETALGSQHVVVLLPPGYDATAAPYPVVVALHGLAESEGSNLDGARAWFDTYDLPAAESALATNHLDASDFGGLVTDARLTAYNDLLAKDAYRGVIVVGVYTPHVWSGPGFAAFDDFVAEDLPDFLKANFRVSSDASDWAIEGVSLGGHHALAIGLKHPDVFGVIGAMQPAIGGDMDGFVAEAAANKGSQRIHLVTSDGDAYLYTTLNYAAYLEKASVPNFDLSVLRGPHGYEFNDGPGAVELLFYMDRVGRGLDPVPSDPISTRIHNVPTRRRHKYVAPPPKPAPKRAVPRPAAPKPAPKPPVAKPKRPTAPRRKR